MAVEDLTFVKKLGFTTVSRIETLLKLLSNFVVYNQTLGLFIHVYVVMD